MDDPKTCKKCKGTQKTTEWHVPLPFNPGSQPQKIALMKHFKLAVPKKRGTDSETTEQKYLKRYAKKYPVFGTVVECQQREKLISTYLWPPAPDGRVRTHYGFNPSTWRTSSARVNLANVPKRGPLAQAFRETVVAAPGHLLMEVDSSAIEAVIVGFCAGDEEYVRVAKAGLHGFVASHRLAARDGGRGIDQSLPFDELQRQCRAIKKSFKVDYEDAKRGNHGVNYMLSAYGMNDEYPETFPTQKSAQQFIDFYHAMFGGKLIAWQQSTLERAHKETYLENHWQGRHYFYEIYSYDRRSAKWRLGDDAKRAVAYVPQSDAAAIQKEDLLAYEDYPELREWERLVTYDSITLEIPEEKVEWAASVIAPIMSRPRAELGGLSIGAEVSVGPSLGEMEILELTQVEPELSLL